MKPFTYKEQQLHIGQISVAQLAKTIGTPFYCYNADYITQQFNYYEQAFLEAGQHNHLIAYALKANSNQAIIKLLANLGSGADIVSLGEMKRALTAGIHPSNIIFSGVGKTQAEIDEALGVGIGCFNIESAAEFEAISERAKSLNKIAPISIRINPNIDAKTHPKIATGLAGNKFGLELQEAMELYLLAQRQPQLKIMGVDVHIGSQICELDPFAQAFAIVTKFIAQLAEKNIYLEHVDIGGGLAIDYSANVCESYTKQNIANYVNLAIKFFGKKDFKIICEPGRSLVGNSGILVSKLIYKKHSYGKNFFIIDAAMNDLLRPTLYNAKQAIISVRKNEDAQKIETQIVGPVCETGDYIAQNYELEDIEQGELIAILGAGAYGAVMSSTYNSRLLIPEILVQTKRFHVIRPRPTYQNLLDLDSIPAWL